MKHDPCTRGIAATLPVVMVLLAASVGCGGRAVPGGGVGDGDPGDAPGLDAGVAADRPVLPLPDGGLASDPGLVVCGDAACSVPRDYCCVEDTASRPVWECREVGAEPPPYCGALERHCDEAADCPGDQRCCVPMTARPFPAYRTECAESCLDRAAYWFQLCSTTAECPEGLPCVRQVCEGLPIQTCGPLDPGYCRAE